jgi:Arc/MetJ-type ribon-helix-helix transcriptional regulator
MRQIKVSLADSHAEFVNQYQLWGFPDKSSLIREALEHLQACLKQERLRQSAKLYAEVYQEDRELQDLTEQALEDWPE